MLGLLHRRPSLTPVIAGALLLPGLAQAADKAVELIEPGQGERIELRYAPGIGTHAERDLTIAISSSMDLGGMKVPQVLPPIRMRVVTNVTEVSEQGHITYDFTINEIHVGDDETEPGVAEPIKGYAAGMVGTSATLQIDPVGNVISSTYSIPDGAPPEILQSFRKSVRDAGAPLPTERVGKGAKWRISESVEDSGVPTEKVSVFTLDEINGKVVRLSTEITQTAPAQDIQDPSLPDGAVARLERLEGKGSGTLELDLGHVLPNQSELSITVDTEVNIGVPGLGSQTMSMTMTVATKVEQVGSR